MHAPEPTYASRLDERRRRVAELEAGDRRLSTARGVLAAVAIVGGLALGWSTGVALALAAAAVLFFALMVAHEALWRRLSRARRRAAFYAAGRLRLRDEWIGRGTPGLAFDDPAHPYAADLDLFGRGSLFERLCQARTHSGQEVLAAWLGGAAEVGDLRQRQAAVAELTPLLDLREDMAVLGAEARTAVDSTTLRRWAAAPPVAIPPGLRTVAAAVSAAALAALAAWLFGPWGPTPFYLATGAVGLVAWRAGRFTDAVLGGIGRPARDLQTLTELFDRIDGEQFHCRRLALLHERLRAGGRPPSRPITQLRRWLEVHDSKSNVFFALVAFYLLWDLQLAAAVEGWRRRFGAAVEEWLAALGEMEALVSLAGYAFENPGDPFPDLVEDGPLFEAQGLGHPLLPRARSVPNDVGLDGQRQLLVVTGSNMSGKSTLLRTVGVNAVLALAGAPVRAASLRLSRLSIGASIRVHDSLQDGESRFYAEIKRIRQVMDIARGAAPALFLVDEIFDGTNSAERRLGAEAVVRALLERRAVGLVTSHDLALAELAQGLAPRAANVHFEDHLEGDRMAFDYRLKPGPVRQGNALRLMKAVGLDV